MEVLPAPLAADVPPSVPQTAAAFTEALARLARERLGHDESGLQNVDCIRSADLTACTRCTFSRDLRRCYRCTYSEGCTDSTALTHCQGCVACHASAYLVDCRHCSASAYLVQSVGCSQCTYCFGCVGLHKKEFHILNRPYGRREYFAVLARMTRELATA